MHKQKDKIVIWGASGHASVIADILNLNGEFDLVGFLDDINIDSHGKDYCGSRILGGQEKLKFLYQSGVKNIIIGIGDCKIRTNLAQIAISQGFSLVNAIHPNSIVAKNVRLGKGIVICGGAVVNVGSIIGDNVIINTCASVDHDCIVNDSVHICPGVHLAGGIEIGKESWIGIGSIVKEKIKIGEHVTIGAGSVVVKNISSNATAYGVPAKIITYKLHDDEKKY